MFATSEEVTQVNTFDLLSQINPDGEVESGSAESGSNANIVSDLNEIKVLEKDELKQNDPPVSVTECNRKELQMLLSNSSSHTRTYSTGIFTSLTDTSGLFRTTSLSIDSINMSLPISLQSLDELTIQLSKQKKGKTKKALATEQLNKVRNIDADVVSFCDLSGSDLEDIDCKWYNLIHENVIKALQDLSLSDNFIRHSNNSNGEHNPDDYYIQIELSKALLCSSNGAKQEFDCFTTIQEKLRLSRDGEQFFATFLMEIPIEGSHTGHLLHYSNNKSQIIITSI